MEKIKLDLEKCKGCYYCVHSCPAGSISISQNTNRKGFRVVKIDREKCIQCGICYRVCPDYVLELL